MSDIMKFFDYSVVPHRIWWTDDEGEFSIWTVEWLLEEGKLTKSVDDIFFVTVEYDAYGNRERYVTFGIIEDALLKICWSDPSDDLAVSEIDINVLLSGNMRPKIMSITKMSSFDDIGKFLSKSSI